MKIPGKLRRDTANQRPGVISKKMIQAYRHMQRYWANWMARRTRGYSRRTWKVLLTTFVISGGLCCICLMFNGLFRKSGLSFEMSAIKVPKYAVEANEQYLDDQLEPEVELKRIRRFKKYMDSLSQSNLGRAVADSMLHHRPGLMDSVKLMENYYQQFKQK